jgi:hypothetical protein
MDILGVLEGFFIFVSSKAGVILFCVAVIIIYLRSRRKKKNKIKLLSKDDRFKNSKVFDKLIKTPITVSPNGYIGIAFENYSNPVIIFIKDICDFKIMQDDIAVLRGGESSKGELLFAGAVSMLEKSFSVKAKRINMLINGKDGVLYNVPVFASSIGKGIMPGNSLKEEIKRLLDALVESEKNVLL